MNNDKTFVHTLDETVVCNELAMKVMEDIVAGIKENDVNKFFRTLKGIGRVRIDVHSLSRKTYYFTPDNPVNDKNVSTTVTLSNKRYHYNELLDIDVNIAASMSEATLIQYVPDEPLYEVANKVENFVKLHEA